MLVDGELFRDDTGRHRVFHGINLVAKGQRGSTNWRDYRGSWAEADLADLADRGLTLVRLGVIWAAVEPVPGQYCREYLDWISAQLDACARHGLLVILDAHQDLYSQNWSDGAPGWATLAEAEYTPTELWSDAYLTEPAVHQALDAFWANTAGPGGIGLQDRFTAMWRQLATRCAGHPALLGYDLLNEPAPGSLAPELFGTLIASFAARTGQDIVTVLADFDDPHAKLAQLAQLEDLQVYRELAADLAPLVHDFEHHSVQGLWDRVGAAIRAVDSSSLILRGNGYFSNLGIPCPIPDQNHLAPACYAPHGYDLVVDTEATPLASNVRAGFIFAQHRQAQQRSGLPVIVGEWGAFGGYTGIIGHANYLQSTFDDYRWSHCYWSWEPGFADTEAAAALDRARPLAFAGTGRSWRSGPAEFTASWTGDSSAQAPTEFLLPRTARLETVTITFTGAETTGQQQGRRVLVDPVDGELSCHVGWTSQ